MIDVYAIYTRAYETKFRESGSRAKPGVGVKAGVATVAEASRRDALQDVVALGEALMLAAPNRETYVAVENYVEAVRRQLDSETENPVYLG